MAWHFTKNGVFSTRSAYFLELNATKQKNASSSDTSVRDVWTKLWRAKTPTKVKNFGWRALHSGIAVYANLKVRGYKCDQMCPLRGEAAKNTIHRLVTCPEAKWVWKASPLRIEVKPDLKCSFKEWCDHFANLIDDDKWWALFWFIVWHIWLRRSKWVFEGKKN